MTTYSIAAALRSGAANVAHKPRGARPPVERCPRDGLWHYVMQMPTRVQFAGTACDGWCYGLRTADGLLDVHTRIQNQSRTATLRAPTCLVCLAAWAGP